MQNKQKPKGPNWTIFAEAMRLSLAHQVYGVYSPIGQAT
jgi:hypothetical protein